MADQTTGPAVDPLDPFERAQAFFEAHDGCPNRVDHLFWMPEDRTQEASVTLTCACGARIVIAFPWMHAAALMVSFEARGIPVGKVKAAGGVH